MLVHRFRRPAVLLAALIALPVLGAAPAAVAAPSGCQPPGATGAYPPSSATIEVSATVVVAGSDLRVDATGFARVGEPGNDGTVAIVLCTDPVLLAQPPIRADGSTSATVTIPATTKAGVHIIQASGPNGRGGTTIVSTNIKVVAPNAVVAGFTSPPAAGGSGSTGVTGVGSGGGGLPFTGAEIAAMALIALLFLAVGAALIAATRRRAAHSG